METNANVLLEAPEKGVVEYRIRGEGFATRVRQLISYLQSTFTSFPFSRLLGSVFHPLLSIGDVGG